MLNQFQEAEITSLVKDSLDRAEETWAAVGGEQVFFMEAADRGLLKKAESVPSQIPGHGLVSDDHPIVDEFVALVADMRDSTNHLLQAISKDRADVSQLKRVYYETSALLPALAKTIGYRKGKVTEYLGDGVLALFQVENKEKRISTVYDAYHAATNCVTATRRIVNAELTSRYRLPALDIGVGMSYSKALVTLVGLPGAKQPKAIGECIYRASKLSQSKNEVVVDDVIRKGWPREEGGKMRFFERSFSGEKGFAILL